MSSNKKIGNHFEAELCEILFGLGFWAHNMAQNQAGQPADVIAVRNQLAYLIDCKVCSTTKGFDLRRVEDNQESAMELWRDRGNGEGWFAIKLPDGRIYLVAHCTIQAMRIGHSYMSETDIIERGYTPEEWEELCAS